jgi:hypothetical protein
MFSAQLNGGTINQEKKLKDTFSLVIAGLILFLFAPLSVFLKPQSWASSLSNRLLPNRRLAKV